MPGGSGLRPAVGCRQNTAAAHCATHLSSTLHGSSAGQLRRQVQLRQPVQLARRQCMPQHPRRRGRTRPALRLQHRQQQAGCGGQALGGRPEEQPAKGGGRAGESV